MAKKKLFNFSWENKKEKIKRENLYQDLNTSVIRMVNVEILIKALRSAYDPKRLPQMRTFYSDILKFSKELKCLYSSGDQL